MKVRTDLQAGNLINDLNVQASEVNSVVQDWLRGVYGQAEEVSSWVTGQLGRVEKLRNCIVNV